MISSEISLQCLETTSYILTLRGNCSASSCAGIRLINDQFGVPDLEVPAKYPDGSLLEKMYTSYNTYVNWNARNSFVCGGNMLDEGMVPPKDFKFFYKASDTYNSQPRCTLVSEDSPSPVSKSEPSGYFVGTSKSGTPNRWPIR